MPVTKKIKNSTCNLSYTWSNHLSASGSTIAEPPKPTRHGGISVVRGQIKERIQRASGYFYRDQIWYGEERIMLGDMPAMEFLTRLCENRELTVKIEEGTRE